MLLTVKLLQLSTANTLYWNFWCWPYEESEMSAALKKQFWSLPYDDSKRLYPPYDLQEFSLYLCVRDSKHSVVECSKFSIKIMLSLIIWQLKPLLDYSDSYCSKCSKISALLYVIFFYCCKAKKKEIDYTYFFSVIVTIYRFYNVISYSFCIYWIYMCSFLQQ